MRIILLLVGSVLVAHTALAQAQEVIYPKNVSKFEYYQEHELRLVQQMVDEGQQKWRTDPENYAKFFMNFVYPNMRPFERDRLNVKVFPKKGRSIVQVFYDGKIHTIYLTKVYPTYPESIWVVEKMLID